MKFAHEGKELIAVNGCLDVKVETVLKIALRDLRLSSFTRLPSTLQAIMWMWSSMRWKSHWTVTSNLLHCKQTFITQLKSGAMGARTIDEGAMDEKSGMNFSEYMAILSGNTDLLEKAKLEKRIASLEGERKSFNKGKANAEFTLNGIQKENEEQEQKQDSDSNKVVQPNSIPTYKGTIRI